MYITSEQQEKCKILKLIFFFCSIVLLYLTESVDLKNKDSVKIVKWPVFI